MPKATLSFNLPEEQEEHKLAMDGARLRYAIDDFDSFLRTTLKYTELTEEQHEVYETVREKLWEFINNE